MSSDYEFSDDDNEYYDGMDMDDDDDVDAQDDGKQQHALLSYTLSN